ncbi:hypothetical protein M8494_23155 [Serratia ureilytica]
MNTPYDCAMTICRDARALAEAMAMPPIPVPA